MSTEFDGFGPALAFLEELALNNGKPWMDANKARYKAELIEPAAAFVTAVGEELRAFAPNVQAVPKVNGSIFRMNRDTRFSPDKTAYKTHLDLWFFEGDRKGWGSSGFYFRMFPTQLILGAGMHQLPKPLLPAFREAVAGPKGTQLVGLVHALTAAGYSVGEETYKRVPAGFPDDHPRAELLRYGALTATIEMPLPPAAHGPELVDLCVSHYRILSPLHTWLAHLVAEAK